MTFLVVTSTAETVAGLNHSGGFSFCSSGLSRSAARKMITSANGKAMLTMPRTVMQFQK